MSDVSFTLRQRSTRRLPSLFAACIADKVADDVVDGGRVHVALSLSHCSLRSPVQGGEVAALAWDNVLGARIDGDRELVVVAYLPSGRTEPRDRQRHEWRLQFDPAHRSLVDALARRVRWLADPRTRDARAAAASVDELFQSGDEELRRRRFLVVINPMGGPGRGQQMYDKHIAPMLHDASIDADVQLTDHARHMIEIAAAMPLGKYDCIVAVGGDGSPCEVFQGLMQREDWRDAIQIPIGVVPGGSGNGLFASLMHACGERFQPVNAGFVLAKGVARPVDCTAVRNPHGDVMYSFLSTTWAFIADMDIESERFRFLGGGRFTVTALKLIFLGNKQYPGTIWYLDDSEPEPPTETASKPPVFRSGDDRPGCDVHDDMAAHHEDQRWKKLDKGLHFFMAMNVSHPAMDSHMAPGAPLDDGFSYLVLIDAEHHHRLQVARLLLSADDGSHVEQEAVSVIKTRAFKVEPSRPDDLICVDGELFRGPVEAQVHRQVARFLCLPTGAEVGQAALAATVYFCEADRDFDLRGVAAMGGLLSSQVPVPDERMLNTILKLKRTASNKTGTIDRAEFYQSIDEKNGEFGDAIFALIDEDNSGQLDFSEYVEALGKFCILNKEDMLKFCFNVFDADKNGTIEGPELTHLLEMLHEDGQTSNMKQALSSFDFNDDGKIDFQEFQQLHAQFPSLLYPAFRIQQNMRIYTMGESWWRRKIEELHRDKAEQLAKLQAQNEAGADGARDPEKEAKEAARKAKLKRQEQAVRIRMGCCMFYCCPCRRHKYVIDESAPSDEDDDDDDDERDKAKRKRAAEEAAKRQQALARKDRRDNVVKITGPRKPLSKEERLERARKRRLRDMADRPTRKG
ncbi:hypothetical protein ATCC90586_005467 [Pythium insidiosum]|nr:hypothetical protein ATCC90586_005467 [Pythium insidiosum]